MRRFLILILLLCCRAAVLPAQDMRVVFKNAPDEIFPLLTKNDRADLVDYIDAGMAAKVTNLFDGNSELLALDEDYLLLATSASSTVQLKLLPLQGDTLICEVRTVKAEASDSRIAFYDMDWNRLDGGAMFSFPAISDFFVAATDADEYADVCDIYLVSLKMNADDNTIVAEYTMPDYMNIEDAGEVKPLLRKLVYNWNGQRFVIE